MADAQFTDPVLARIYDDVDGRRDDLDPYVELAAEFGANTVVDVGCGTGSLAILLAAAGHQVIGVDPAEASIAVARTKPGADRVRWVVGDVHALPTDAVGLDLAVMTGNVAQVFVDDDSWRRTLTAIQRRLAASGAFVFETRDPAARAWEGWDTGTEPVVYETVDGPVEFRRDLVDVDERGGTVTFRATYRFGDGTERTSTSTLRFRDRNALEAELEHVGFTVIDVRDAPDRPGLEFVVIARPEPS